MYLLDTNQCSRVILGDPVAVAQLRLFNASDLATSTIVCGELVYMAQKSEQIARNIAFVEAFLGKFHIYPVDEATSNIYGKLKADLLRHFGPKEKARRSKVTIQQLGFSDNDIWIAATAIQHNLTIVSLDSDFSRMQEAWPFPLESW